MQLYRFSITLSWIFISILIVSLLFLRDYLPFLNCFTWFSNFANLSSILGTILSIFLIFITTRIKFIKSNHELLNSFNDNREEIQNYIETFSFLIYNQGNLNKEATILGKKYINKLRQYEQLFNKAENSLIKDAWKEINNENPSVTKLIQSSYDLINICTIRRSED